MRIQQFTIRNIQEALDALYGTPKRGDNSDAFAFLKAIKSTKPGERENIAIQTVDPEP